ncbi:hypothetical protein [Novosphingobium aquae]|jgi:hypothetical protein|uniref:Uncharacterized protein n=1 Tax=Novosphingobium aquae TaxID=3133435 RepID=A0ABU8SBC5_9SPHN
MVNIDNQYGDSGILSIDNIEKRYSSYRFAKLRSKPPLSATSPSRPWLTLADPRAYTRPSLVRFEQGVSMRREAPQKGSGGFSI